MSALNLLLLNIKNQSQRCARTYNIQLCEAYEIISWAFYHCSNYQDLRKKLLEQEQKSHWFELAKISSLSKDKELDKLKEVLPILVARLSSRILCNTNRLGLTEQIFTIFGLPVPEKCFETLFLNINAKSAWKVIHNSELSPYTVLENKVKINDICYRLLAINVFMPSHWPLKVQEHINIVEEISPNFLHEYELNVVEPMTLQSAVHSYIQARLKDPEDEDIEFHYPLIKLSKSEKKIKKNIQKLLEIMLIDDWPDLEHQPIPFNFRGENMLSNNYLVFGYPTAESEDILSNKWIMDPSKCSMIDTQTFLLDDVPLSLMWISVEPNTLENKTEDDEPYNTIFSLFSEQDGFVPKLEKQGGMSQLLLIKPACHSQIRRDLELKPYVDESYETWLVKVENSYLAELVINKIYNKELFAHISKNGSKKIICKVDCSLDHATNLSLLLEIYSNCFERFLKLITSIYYSTNDDRVTLLIEISDYFINTCKVINKEELIKSMKNGLIHHVEKDTFSNLDDDLSNYLEDLPALSESDSIELNSLVWVGVSNKQEFLKNLRMPQFERSFK